MKWRLGAVLLALAAALRLLLPGGISAVRGALVDRTAVAAWVETWNGGAMPAWAEEWREDAVAVFGQTP